MPNTNGFVGRQPVRLSTSEARGSVATTRASADANGALAARMAAGVEAWEFDGRQVAASLLGLDPAHQKRVGQIVFHLIRQWGVMAGHGHGPEHPMYPEWQAAQAMMANLGNVKIPG